MVPKPTASRIARIVAGLFTALPLLAGAVLWLAGTEPALRWAARQAEAMSGGRLAVQGLHGSLYGPLRIESLSLITEEKRFDLKEAHLDWSPSALLRRHIRVDELAIRELAVVELKPSLEPPELPETLRLPASLSVPSLRIDRLVLKLGEAEHVLAQLALSVEKPGDTYRLALMDLTTPWGRGRAEATLAEARPFDLTARASLQQKDGWPYELKATASGNLSRIALAATVISGGGQAAATAILAPFDKRPLAEASLDASGIDPARLAKDWPQAEISARATLRSQGDESYAGEIRVRNTQPGPWDKAHLPLAALSAAFTGTPEQVVLSGLRLDLGQAGRFEGGGQIKDEQLQLNLGTRSFDPQGVHSRMRSLKLAGDLRLVADIEKQALVADLAYQRYQLHLDVLHQDETLEIKEVLARSAGGSLRLHGDLDMAEPRRFQLAGALEGFGPAAFGDYPSAQVNASFSASGRLTPEPEAAIRFAIADSHFRRQPLSGQGSLDLSAKRIRDSDVALGLARNSLQLKGSLGAPGDRLVFRLDADDLAVIDPRLAGRIRASATLEGRYTAASGAVDVEAEALSWGKDYRIAGLRINGRLDKGLDGPLEIQGRAEGIAAPRTKLDQARVAGHGSRAKHALQLAVKGPDIDLDAHLAGGWRDEAGWSGQVRSFVNRGRHPVALMAPARLEAAPQHFLLTDARVDFAGAAFTIHEAAYKAGQIASRGEFEGLPASYLQNLAQLPADPKTDLSLGGDWRIDAGDKANGRVRLWREGGDIVLPTIPRTALGLNRLALDVEALDNTLRGRLEATGTTLGTLGVEAQSLLSRRDGVWGIAGDAPVQATADLAAQSVAWAAPLIDKSGAITLDGAINGQVRASGTWGLPRLAGSLEGERFKLELPEQGTHLGDGRFLAELEDETLVLKSLRLRGGEGEVTGEGQLALRAGAPEMEVVLRADRLEVLSRPDRHLILSGTGTASVVEDKVQVSAALKANRGVIELPKGDAPSPSEDVIVLGRTKPVEKKGPPYAVRFDLDLDLGERFFLKGRGLDAQLGGAVKLASVDGATPRATGSIRVVKGAYAAYGQHLAIERGILNFQGPVDNPGLDIVAMRKNQAVEAGVAITGSAQNPRVKLVSNPNVPDSEKLSWLVLGHGVEGSSGLDFTILQAAAAALLTAGESITLQQRIAHAAGLDEVSLKGTGALENTVLTLGKRLSSRAYLSYEMGLSSADTMMAVTYTLSEHLSVRARAGSIPAVDLFYTFSFD